MVIWDSGDVANSERGSLRHGLESGGLIAVADRGRVISWCGYLKRENLGIRLNVTQYARITEKPVTRLPSRMRAIWLKAKETDETG